jgi:hypothetical protein
MSHLAKREEHLAFSIGGSAPNPIKMVPESLRAPLSFFWMCFAKLLPSIVPVAALLMTWRRQGELTDEQIVEIMQGLTRPERVASFRFGSDVQCALAEQVSSQIRRNKSLAEMVARRNRVTLAAPKEFSVSEAFRKLTEGIGK